ncbi:MAG: alpha-glucosidase/alpha-galactosidase [Spirochaetaceae bacterium]|nr:MAG: alpha-glucosidase/alpha-galactosidase [Spirochaetaceae bacterium]
MSTSFKVAFVGAGSIGFTRRLIQDLMGVEEFNSIEIALMDISRQNLEMVTQLVRRDLESNGKTGVKLTSTTDRAKALRGARYVLCVVRIGGLEAFTHDIEVPLKYGVDQCVGDTLCAGGIMYGQRNIPFFLDLCRDIREHAEPGALLLNYANPMAMNTWAANTYGGVKTIGLCHGVQHGHAQIADALGIPKEELDYICAGINHQTWYVQLRHKGRDITSAEVLAAFEKHPKYSKTEKVRIDMLRRFGYYSTESNGHLSEYLPWYRKRVDEIMNWIELGSWIDGETGGYLRVCTEKRNWFEEDFPRWLAEPPHEYGSNNRSSEHGSYIIEGLETGRVYRGHFNVVNNGYITNLSNDAIVEVPGYVDANGVNIPVVGDLPLGCAAVCATSVSVQRLSVEAAVHGDDTLLRQAMMMDPLTGAVCTPPEIWQMTDEFLVAHAEWLPQYSDAIAAARARLAKGPLIPTKTTRGAARVAVKSVDELRKADSQSGVEVEQEAGKTATEKG